LARNAVRGDTDSFRLGFVLFGLLRGMC
jgi:hypothetical protein